MSKRPPAVAGSFYPADPTRLRLTVAALTPSDRASRPACAVVVPHAGYTYSGGVAGETFAGVEVPERVCILATNHTRAGPAFSVWPGGAWETPMGEAPVDDALTRAILDGCPGAEADESAHRREHSAEVEVPFVLHRNPAARIVVVTVAYFRMAEPERLRRLEAFGRALGGLAAAERGGVLIVASTDMTHCGADFDQQAPDGMTADAFARAQDRLALEPLLALDGGRFYRTVRDCDVTMCGWAPALAGMAAAREMGARKANLVRYATSADVSGDTDRVVGYAGVLLG